MQCYSVVRGGAAEKHLVVEVSIQAAFSHAVSVCNPTADKDKLTETCKFGFATRESYHRWLLLAYYERAVLRDCKYADKNAHDDNDRTKSRHRMYCYVLRGISYVGPVTWCTLCDTKVNLSAGVTGYYLSYRLNRLGRLVVGYFITSYDGPSMVPLPEPGGSIFAIENVCKNCCDKFKDMADALPLLQFDACKPAVLHHLPIPDLTKIIAEYAYTRETCACALCWGASTSAYKIDLVHGLQLDMSRISLLS